MQVTVGRVHVKGAAIAREDSRLLEQRVFALVSSPARAPVQSRSHDRVDELAHRIAAQITSELGRRS